MEGNDSMTGGADYEFEWDDAKAENNLSKHGVAFMDAMSVLLDPLAMTRFDDEERWVAWGAQQMGGYCWSCIHSAFSATGPHSALVRLVSARPATRREIEQYEQG